MDKFDYTEGLHDGFKSDAAKGRFFQEPQTCPFCQKELERTFSDGIISYNPEDKDTSKDIHHSITAKTCPCGWWIAYNTQTKNAHDLYAMDSWTFCYSGYLRKLVAPKSTSLKGAIRTRLNSIVNELDLSDPLELERIVASVVERSHPDDRIMHCGKSVDGRTDLILVAGPNPFAMKIYRSKKADSVFSVQYISHLVGVVLKDDSPKELLFATAPEFKVPTCIADGGPSSLKKCAIDSVAITAEKSLLDYLAMTNKNQGNAWKRCIPNFILRDHGPLTPYSIYLKQP